MQGKGHVIRRMFTDIDADYYVLVDGDATYEAAAATTMLHTAMTEGLRYGEWRSRDQPGRSVCIISHSPHLYGSPSELA